jgi:hypothetical protein
MNMSNRPMKSNRVAMIFHESVFQALLFVAVVGALVDRGVALMGGAMI